MLNNKKEILYYPEELLAFDSVETAKDYYEQAFKDEYECDEMFSNFLKDNYNALDIFNFTPQEKTRAKTAFINYCFNNWVNYNCTFCDLYTSI